MEPPQFPRIDLSFLTARALLRPTLARTCLNLLVIAVMLAAAFVVPAQPPAKVYHVGVLATSALNATWRTLPRNRKQEGTGLGLTLTRKFVELHGGSVEVTSVPSLGSTFTVSLPLPS